MQVYTFILHHICIIETSRKLNISPHYRLYLPSTADSEMHSFSHAQKQSDFVLQNVVDLVAACSICHRISIEVSNENALKAKVQRGHDNNTKNSNSDKYTTKLQSIVDLKSRMVFSLYKARQSLF